MPGHLLRLLACCLRGHDHGSGSGSSCERNKRQRQLKGFRDFSAAGALGSGVEGGTDESSWQAHCLHGKVWCEDVVDVDEPATASVSIRARDE